MYDKNLETIINEIAGPNWVCPKPPDWNELYDMLPDRKRVGAGSEPPVPLILSAWWHTSDTEKKQRFLIHLRWARDKSVLDKILSYLKELDKGDWIRMGEGPKPENQVLSPEEKLLSFTEIEDTEEMVDALKFGADVNTTNEYGQSPLDLAVLENFFQGVEIILQHGAKVNLINKYGETALDCAVYNKHKEITDLLRKHGGKTGEELKAEGK